MLRFTKTAKLTGCLWVSSDGSPAAGTSVSVLTAATINGAFGRVRALPDDLRLALDTSTPGTLNGTLEAYTGLFYGFDTKFYPAAIPAITSPPPVSVGLAVYSVMQQLFENTPFAVVGVYVAPAINHPDQSWMRKIALLRQQGWGLLPVYVGRQQGGAGVAQVGGDPNTTAAQQGIHDANEAAGSAGTAGLATGTVIFLDIETDQDLSQDFV